MNDVCARVLFVEMLFGKRVWEAQLIQNQYCWKVKRFAIPHSASSNVDYLFPEHRNEFSESGRIGDDSYFICVIACVSISVFVMRNLI